MNIQQLDDDCLKAILVRLPLKDFIRNVKPLSRRFRDATEFSLKDLIAREPFALEVRGGCKHAKHSSVSPKIILAGMPVSSTSLSELEDCSLLPLVSSVSLSNPFCDEVPMEFKLQLRTILQKLSSATKLELPVSATGHYGRRGDYAYFDDDSDDDGNSSSKQGVQRPFWGIVFNAASLLSQLQSLEFSLLPPEDLRFSRDNLNDFAQFLTFAKHLKHLVIPICLFKYATGTDEALLHQLNTLVLFASETGRDSASCQDIFNRISDLCPELSELRYNCILPRLSSTECCNGECVSDFSVLEQLEKLRSLTLRLGDAGDHSEPLIASLPSVEFLSLTIPEIYDAKKVDRALQLTKISSNLKTLQLLQQEDIGSEPLATHLLIDRLKSLLMFGALHRLEKLFIIASKPSSAILYELIHLITAIPAHISLRKVKVSSSGSAVILANATSPSLVERGSTGMCYAIAKAENITELSFPMAWVDSYLQLEQLLLSMQRGSIRCLVVTVDWDSARAEFGIDRRVVSAVLPVGCHIADWICNMKDGKGILKSIVVAGYKLGLDDTPVFSEDNKFFVYFEARCFLKMNIQQLDDDCLKAVLIRLPIKDVIKNVKPVSRRFRDATEFSLKHIVAREPVSLEVCGGCKHYLYLDDRSPKVTLAGVRIRTKNLSSVKRCSLLPLVSRVSLCDPFCSDVPRDFKVQLHEILQKLSSAATHLVLPLQANGHYGVQDNDMDSLDCCSCVSVPCNEHGLQRPFSRLIVKAVHLLPPLQTLEFKPFSNSYLQFSSENLTDFSQLLSLSRHLRKLIIPIRLFEAAVKSDRRALLQLDTLELFATERDSHEAKCQRTFDKIASACPELTELRYGCAVSMRWHCCNAAKGCVTNFAVLRRLRNLRSLTLCLGGTNWPPTKMLITTIPSIECLSLDLSNCDRQAAQMMQLLKISSNLKTLQLRWRAPSTEPMTLVEQLEETLLSGALPLLETIHIISEQHSYSVESVCNQIHAITTIPNLSSLRKITIVESSDKACVVFLPSSNASSLDQAEPGSTGITYAIAKAENITDLRFPMTWNDSYLQLEQLLLAMQHGSLKRLTVTVDWHCDGRHHFGIDKRVVAAVLPAGCQIAAWNISMNNANPTSFTIVGQKSSLSSAGFSGKLDEGIRFWVRIEENSKCENSFTSRESSP